GATRGAAHCSRRRRLATGVPRTPWAEEKADLDTVLGAEPGHLPDLRVGEHHDAAPLGDAADGDVAGHRLLEDGPHHVGPLHGGDLDPVPDAVREPHVSEAYDQKDSKTAGSVGSASTSRMRPAWMLKRRSWSRSRRSPFRSPDARYNAAARSSE